ncbi:PD-(D/E)XK nuclease family protein [Collinsella stercoris]|nr:PD-(D/E)XK nuclease family protein [Collinsella stercoris]UEA45761.1 PD-(D/E)XK nuclease family protein [Collinsella stercoris DSM 13279]UWP11716.1 PD-(D/E)XK nuclease family protein [Collinsella stercoris]
MAGSIHITHAGTELLPAEVELVRSMARRHGRATLLVPSFAEMEVCRQGLANAGAGTSVDVLTPAAWVEGLWRLLGDGSRLVTSTDRLLLCSYVLGSTIDAGEGDSCPVALTDNPGTVHMLAEAARTCLPAACRADERVRAALSDSERRVLGMLACYEGALRSRDLSEPASAAFELASQFETRVPPCARAVAVRGVAELPEHLLRLLGAIAQEGEVAMLLNGRQRSLARDLAKRFAWRCAELDGAGPRMPDLAFAEVSGPTARASSYVRLLDGMMVGSAGAAPREGASPAPGNAAPRVGSSCPDAPGAPAKPAALAAAETSPDSERFAAPAELAIGAPDAIGLFRTLAPRLAVRGVAASTEAFVPFTETRAGEEFFMLIDFLDRLNGREVSSWWPAPEIVDWLRSPFSGTGGNPFVALSLDTYLRKTRSIDKERLFAELDSRQSREANRERKAAQAQERAARPVVFKAVIDALDAGAYVRALTLMRDACSAAAPFLFGEEGQAAQQIEFAALQRAIEVLERAAELGVRPERALVALRAAKVFASIATQVGEGAPRAAVRIARVESVACSEAGSYAAVLVADAGADAYPLAVRETPASVLAEKLGCEGASLSPAERQRDQFARALQAAGHAAALAYVGRDNASEELYPALAYAELRAAAREAGAATDVAGLPGEGELFANADAAGGVGAHIDDVPRLPEHALPRELRPYVLLPQRCINGRPLTRTLSASQVENYLACPYRWFVNSRVVTRRLDVEFGPIERGNFSHDVMQRFYERLAECGLVRVRPQTVDACIEQMDIAFDEVRADHLRGKYTHGKYAAEERPRAIRGALVPLDELERMRVDAMREQFHEVVRHEADLLPIYEPARFEYSFDKQGVTYAGRPLGGRIDRIDVAPDAGSGKRFVVIDYKTGANVDAMACPDPTMQLDEGEQLAADWLPGRDRDKAPKVQTLMYATALERMTGGSAQGAVYYGLRGPSIAGAVSSALTECEPSAFPLDKKACPYPGVKGRSRVKRDGDMEFPELLERVERGIARELDALESGAIAPRPASDSCSFCPLTMCEKRR